MSVPAINLYTHGTHITVAHTMGATIGINTMLLLAIAFDILGNTCKSFEPYKKMINRGYWMANFSLLIFWLALIIAGILKSKWQMSTPQIPYGTMMLQLRPYLIAFVIAGGFLMIGILMVIYPLIKNQIACYFRPIEKTKMLGRKKLNPALSFH